MCVLRVRVCVRINLPLRVTINLIHSLTLQSQLTLSVLFLLAFATRTLFRLLSQSLGALFSLLKKSTVNKQLNLKEGVKGVSHVLMREKRNISAEPLLSEVRSIRAKTMRLFVSRLLVTRLQLPLCFFLASQAQASQGPLSPRGLLP